MIPRTLFDADLEGFRDSVRKFLEQEAAPYHDQWEKDGQVSRELWQKAGELGFLCPTMPEEYGGVGADFRYSAVVIEEISRAGLSGIGWGLHSDIVAPYILNYGSAEQKQKYLPKLVSGEMIGAIAMTEPGAGSDLLGPGHGCEQQPDRAGRGCRPQGAPPIDSGAPGGTLFGSAPGEHAAPDPDGGGGHAGQPRLLSQAPIHRGSGGFCGCPPAGSPGPATGSDAPMGRGPCRRQTASLKRFPADGFGQRD